VQRLKDVTRARVLVQARALGAAERAADREQLGEGARDQRLQGGQRGAGDGDVDFGAGPDCCADAVARRVRGDGDFVEAFEADDACDADAGGGASVLSFATTNHATGDLQATEGEDEHEADLLIAWQVEGLQERHRERKHHDVGSDVQGRVGEPECQLVHAVAVDGLVPEVGHGNAHEERATEGPEAVDGGNADHDVAEALDLSLGEDSDVLEDDRDLGEDHGQVVHRDSAP
jgi:hypothetical protein